jgi:hypothetical protein
MKRALSALLVASMVATSIPAWADATTPVTVVTPTPVVVPSPSISPLTKGQPAPYVGVLMSPEAVAQLISQQDATVQALKLAVQHQVDLDAAQLKYQVAALNTSCTADKSDLQAQVDDGKKQVSVLTAQVKSNSGGLGAPIWLGIGVVGGIVVSVLTTFAISKATK